MMYELAEKLGKTVGEIMHMTTTEFMGWIVYKKLLTIQRKQGKHS
ncbi:MAG: hypothetical protein ACRCT6_09685 [Notoacmeibacter sp.]